MEQLVEFQAFTVTGSFGNEAVVLGEERPGEAAEHLSDR